MAALNFLLPLFVFLLVSGLGFAQKESGHDKAVKSVFSDPGRLETEQDPVDYRSGNPIKLKPPQILEPPPPAALNIPKISMEPIVSPVPTYHFASVPRQADDIPAAEALPRLEAMVSETRAINKQAKAFLEKLEQDPNNPQSISFMLTMVLRESENYFNSHLVEHGTPQEWVDYAKDPKKIPFITVGITGIYFDYAKITLNDTIVGSTIRVMQDYTRASNGQSVWGGEETVGAYDYLGFYPFFNYHLFALKYAVQFVKENGFAPKKDLEQMEKGFLEWKKEEPRLRALISQYVPLRIQLRKSEEKEIVDRDILESIHYKQIIPIWTCFGLLHDAPFGQEGYLAFPPDPAVVSKILPECQSVVSALWQTLYEISKIYADVTWLSHQRFFKMFGEGPSMMNKVPGAGPDEII